ncbi:MAG: efflux transporter outer membrane subunit [SAR324 cluster bacterium]|nr:efflux transporter outer membrane subunit [SAR324 cluster bacterium]
MESILRSIASCVGVALSLFAAACTTVGPDYERPDEPVPEAFVETGPWKEAVPRDDIAKGTWWEIFGDPILNDLEAQALGQSLDLRAAAARVAQSQAIAGISGTFLAPTLNLAASSSAFGVSGNRPDQPSKVSGNVAYSATENRVPLYASYEVDMWGRLKRLSEAADARFEASLAEYYTVLLTLEGEVAQTYFRLRAVDEILRILRENIALRTQARDIVAARLRGGLASELDLARIEAERAFTQAEAESAKKSRTEFRNQLAVLIGRPPQEFTIDPVPFQITVPSIPVGLPSDLLERRPDVAEAERRLAARNAAIGVAKAAYFPSITLTGAVGFQSSELGDLFDRDSQIWSVGISVFEPIFNSGRIDFDVKRAEAAYAENLAVYQARILVAFQEVETSLGGLRLLHEQANYQEIAVTNASRATELASLRHQAGLVLVLEVIDAQRTSLLAERQVIDVTRDRLLTTVALVKALGGGWQDRPMPNEIAGENPLASQD